MDGHAQVNAIPDNITKGRSKKSFKSDFLFPFPFNLALEVDGEVRSGICLMVTLHTSCYIITLTHSENYNRRGCTMLKYYVAECFQYSSLKASYFFQRGSNHTLE